MEMADWDLRNSDIPVQIKCTICLWDEKSLTGRDRGIMWPIICRKNCVITEHFHNFLCELRIFFVFKISQQGIKAGSLKERNRTQKVYFSK